MMMETLWKQSSKHLVVDRP